MRLDLATWNTMGWSARIAAYIKTLKQDVLALTECGAEIQKFAGPGLLVADPPPKNDPKGVAAIHVSPHGDKLRTQWQQTRVGQVGRSVC